MRKTTPERFWAKVDKTTTPNDCWLWTGFIQKNGYPKFNDGRSGYAHRASWEIANAAEIPPGLTIDHLCNIPACVRPDHLRLATQRENILRSNNPPAQRAAQTECIYGHDLGDAYLHHSNNGQVWRRCRPCTLRRHREYRRRKSLATPAA